VKLAIDIERGGDITALALAYGITIEFICPEWRST
jgi:hypothetical protein